MSRTIKFRAQDFTHSWNYGFVAKGNESAVIFPVADDGKMFLGIQIYVLPETIGQFTGMHDKNGKEIYEGDIVEVYDFTSVYANKYQGVVKMIHCTWVVEYEGMFGISHPKLSFDDFAERKTEVIGNIYDNPELAKGGKYGNEEMRNMRSHRPVKSKKMDTKLSIKKIEEMIISNEVSLRNEIAIPNLSWGMLPYEADLVVINKTGYMREYEIKRSLQDLKADFKKKCYHDAEQVYQFFYVLPISIKEKALELFRTHQNDDAYIKAFGKSTEYYEALPAVIFYNDDGYIAERTRFDSHLYGNHRKLFLEERLAITRLISIRYWNLRLNKHEKD